MDEVGMAKISENSSSSSLSISEKLDRIVTLDQDQRKNFDPQKYDINLDRKNRSEVQAMIDLGQLSSPDDYRKAALIFQHGETIEDFTTAFDLSFKSAELGNPPFTTMLAQSFDRLMVTLQQNKGMSQENIRQRFGTQFTHGGVYYQIDDETPKEYKEHLIPNTEDFRKMTNDKQQEVYQGLDNQWRVLSVEDRIKILTEVREDLNIVIQSFS